jgi:hypothetical protein
MVPILSSAAKIPFPFATIDCATASSSCLDIDLMPPYKK